VCLAFSTIPNVWNASGSSHQQIAGYDNSGKALYTTIRELVENALDACESIGQLPHISIQLTEYTTEELNAAAASSGHAKVGSITKSARSSAKKAAKPATTTSTTTTTTASATKKGNNSHHTKPEAFFLLSVKDNGCGMVHAAIPHLLGRVLSGSKHGVRQTRGKFGLGAKMALIWAKKSTGRPIRITTSHRLSAAAVGPTLSQCTLDINIVKNEPKILKHTSVGNTQGYTGTELQVWIAGNWTTYRARIAQYLQQLAIITPYAVLELHYANAAGDKAYHLRYDRRSEQMPPVAPTVAHHPASVNNLVLQQLRDKTKAKSLVRFLTNDLSGVSTAAAQKVLQALPATWASPEGDPHDLTDAHVTRLVQVLRTRPDLFRAPDGACLSPLGEYNLNLGIRKVLAPDLVATARDKAGAYEGHSFLVEAAVSLGGGGSSTGKHATLMMKKEEGITVCRFANRIPLLFEGGADVVTRVALSKIKWSQYKMDPKRDKIGVFVSIVSTKIPFKGTSKEYIGDDATAIQISVKRALQACCQQLRVHLSKRQHEQDAQQRKSRLTKYIPDVGRSLFGLLGGMRDRQQQAAAQLALDEDALPKNSPAKRLRLDPTAANSMMGRLERHEITEATIVQALHAAIKTETAQSDEQRKAAQASRQPLFLLPLYNLESAKNDFSHSEGLFTFRSLVPVKRAFSPSPAKSSDSDDSF
jgi:DNA topoisomerase-6 subunit B